MTTLLSRAALLAAAAVLAAPAALAAQAATNAPRVGVVVVAHGGDSVWNAHVRQTAAAAKVGGPVEVSFLMGAGARTARFQDAVARVRAAGATEVVVVPMLVSSHSGHYDQIRWLAGDSVTLDEQMTHHLHMAGIERPAAGAPLRLTPAMDAAPEVARVLADRALAIAPQPRGRALLIVGHGPNSAEDYAAWMDNLRPIADSVKAIAGFRDVRVELVRDDAPAPVRAEAVRRVRELIELQHLATGQEVVVVPVLVSKGSVSRDKVPNDIRGTPSVYTGEPLAPHPAMARWVEARVRGALAR
ncbi:CbiX/SirB N-terminal domain-containing protein [Roseisolibacter sp. H3M3-2]|uniref:CbiX/SirB N-terminal domain-containing protein n=1 Tax=Roseisolibacter sp. H3M3-2 TaxID=3031323 RepID=UPI0023D9B91A|nr:CbiX/SirB N-terminal domain-containing protein [Roseisolibacter sp. H3M3-2]MDF1505196.1 CbiX/SirB N-terminal domain-containing protein [Roseisolibacter sp. H3M3-2]